MKSAIYGILLSVELWVTFHTCFLKQNGFSLTTQKCQLKTGSFSICNMCEKLFLISPNAYTVLSGKNSMVAYFNWQHFFSLSRTNNVSYHWWHQRDSKTEKCSFDLHIRCSSMLFLLTNSSQVLSLLWEMFLFFISIQLGVFTAGIYTNAKPEVIPKYEK